MKITKRQLRRIIKEELSRQVDPLGALSAAQEMGYDLNVPIMVDSNQMAIDDALAGYPGEFTYDDIVSAVNAAVKQEERYAQLPQDQPHVTTRVKR